MLSAGVVVRERIYGFDYLRALMSIFVVIWHLTGAENRGDYYGNPQVYSPPVADIMSFNVFLMAVPSFFFVSFFLYGIANPTKTQLVQRLSRYLTLYLFWVLVVCLFFGGYRFLDGVVSSVFSSPVSAYLTLFSGAGSIYYFFIDLFVLTIILHFALKIGTLLNGVFLVVSLLLVFSMPTLAVESLKAIQPGSFKASLFTYWSPINFLPYVFLAALVALNLEFVKKHRKHLILLGVVPATAFIIYEWSVLPSKAFILLDGHIIPAYMRTSLIFSTFLVSCVFLFLQRKPGVLVMFMSKYSLALYCLHFLVFQFVKQFNDFSGIYMHTFNVCGTVLCSYLLAWVLRDLLAKKLLF
jgi:hypothetical protein